MNFLDYIYEIEWELQPWWAGDEVLIRKRLFYFTMLLMDNPTSHPFGVNWALESMWYRLWNFIIYIYIYCFQLLTFVFPAVIFIRGRMFRKAAKGATKASIMTSKTEEKFVFILLFTRGRKWISQLIRMSLRTPLMLIRTWTPCYLVVSE